MWDIVGMPDSDYTMYGNYRNKKFADIFSTVNDFREAYYGCGITPELKKEENLNNLYYMLYARYGNSTIASSDENQFKYKVFTLIYEFGPTWEKELQIQKEVREMSDEELMEGSTRIMNRAANPDVAPNDHSLSELPYISEQNVSKTKRGKIEQYTVVLDLLKRDVSEYFLAKFKPLFLTIVAPEKPLWYVEEK